MNPGATALTVMPSGASSRAQLTHEPDLRALGGGVGRAAGRRPVGDLGVDVDDAAEAARPHRGQHGAAEQDRAADEEVELREVVVPGRPRRAVPPAAGRWR